jgi:hypothetical protein
LVQEIQQLKSALVNLHTNIDLAINDALDGSIGINAFVSRIDQALLTFSTETTNVDEVIIDPLDTSRMQSGPRPKARSSGRSGISARTSSSPARSAISLGAQIGTTGLP